MTTLYEPLKVVAFLDDNRNWGRVWRTTSSGSHGRNLGLLDAEVAHSAVCAECGKLRQRRSPDTTRWPAAAPSTARRTKLVPPIPYCFDPGRKCVDVVLNLTRFRKRSIVGR